VSTCGEAESRAITVESEPMSTSEDRLGFLAVALDTADWGEFESWCDLFGRRAGVLKVGLEAYVRWGPRAVSRARESGARIFLDLKLHDIPNTVAGGVRAAAGQGVSYLTVHSSGGPRMLGEAVAAAAGQVGILAVTLLTHLDEAELSDLDMPGSAETRVARWAQLAVNVGCAGVVCSPLEVGRLRTQLGSGVELVTPGIRPLTDTGQAAVATDDQRRVATPADALADGASLLVIGRPLTRAADPEAVLESLARVSRQA
jgi:orotidine-5'-phosphate decarboxylase